MCAWVSNDMRVSYLSGRSYDWTNAYRFVICAVLKQDIASILRY